jgi:hypothetical protein
LISGTPTAAATSTVTVSATNSGGTGSATLTLTVKGRWGAPSPIRSQPRIRPPVTGPQDCRRG